jgi:hypothetical protein
MESAETWNFKSAVFAGQFTHISESQLCSIERDVVTYSVNSNVIR